MVCSGVKETEGCAILETDKISKPSVRCRFVSCLERNSYICEENTAKQEAKETTTEWQENETNITRTTDQIETERNRTSTTEQIEMTDQIETGNNRTPTTEDIETETRKYEMETTDINKMKYDLKPIDDGTGRTTTLL